MPSAQEASRLILKTGGLLMQKFERADFEVAEYVESENYGKFVLAPLERGFGTTIGNALRRVLLSSLRR